MSKHTTENEYVVQMMHLLVLSPRETKNVGNYAFKFLTL